MFLKKPRVTDTAQRDSLDSDQLGRVFIDGNAHESGQTQTATRSQRSTACKSAGALPIDRKETARLCHARGTVCVFVLNSK